MEVEEGRGDAAPPSSAVALRVSLVDAEDVALPDEEGVADEDEVTDGDADSDADELDVAEPEGVMLLVRDLLLVCVWDRVPVEERVQVIEGVEVAVKVCDAVGVTLDDWACVFVPDDVAVIETLCEAEVVIVEDPVTDRVGNCVFD